MRIRAIVSYDGTDYAGFQRQADVITVQEALEDSLLEVTQEQTTVLAAGRTDAGVHAVGQVIAFDTAWGHGTLDLHRALNAVLPQDIAVRALDRTEDDFHPRFEARRRWYRYRVLNGPIRAPLARRYSLHVPYPLDVEVMGGAARLLVGEQDFATFGQPPQGDATVREVFRAKWEVESAPGGPFESATGEDRFLRFDVEANAFLYRMVRSIVGTLLEVGQGRMSMGTFESAFRSRERGQAGKTAAPEGLCLMRVGY